MTTIHESAAKGFSAGADAYERGRPDYSPAAIEHLVRELGIGPDSRVLDLAAGTGKLTRQIAPTGAEIVAVEPVEAMRAKLAEAMPGVAGASPGVADATPGVEAIDGTAEAIPLPNHSVDAVVVGQAFHWFDGVRALSEIRRVLKPGGGLGLIWQVRDPNRPWIERLDEIIDRVDDGHPRYRSGAWRTAFELTALFEPLDIARFDHVQRGSVETIVDRVGSISYIAAMPRERREGVLHEVRDLLASDPETAGRDVIELPYHANVYWTRPTVPPPGPSSGLVVAVNVSPGGVPKRPIAGTRVRRGTGLDGDAHQELEDHGSPSQAVCLYSVESIERVAAEGHQAFPGAYGENLTLAGFDWGGLRSGDRMRIGDAGPLIELTDFATPCAKQARWFIDERIGRISSRAHPEDARWYASVIEEGPVAPGDEVRLTRTA